MFLLAMACTLPAVVSWAWGAASPPTPDEGRKVFETKPCAACHSVDGKGGAVGPKLDGIGAKRNAEWLRKKIVAPKFNAPNTIMPAVELKPRELDTLASYLASLKPPSAAKEPSKKTETPPKTDAAASPEAKKPSETAPPEPMPSHETASSDTSRGKAIFEERACRGCHALGGQGGNAGPSLDDVGHKRDADWLRVQITNPKAHNPNTIMPATNLPKADLDALVGFLLAQKSAPSTSTPTPVAPSGQPRFVGSQACMPCHSDIAQQFRRTVHSDALMEAHGPEGKTGCESCHGPGSQHAATGDPKLIIQPAKLTPRHNSELCMRCHTGQVTQHDWLTSAHSQAGLSCSSCHQVMRQVVSKLLKKPANELCASCHRREAAQFAGVSHHPLPEGRMQCSDCHNPHSGVNEAMLRQPVNEQCISCHSDKQGPFEFEHPAVTGGFTEGCMSCHQPHGSPFKDLRKIAGRGLCIQCHTDKAVRHFDTYPDCTTAGCHTQIHGSHEDQLFFR